MKSTLPTGKDAPVRLRATPRSEPAHATAYSGASSQKYFKLFKASLHSWISSRTIRVEVGEIFFPVISSIDLMSFKGSLVRLKSSFMAGIVSKLMYTISSKDSLPNFFNAHDLPTWRAPCNTKGLRRGFSFHAFNLSNIPLCISAIIPSLIWFFGKNTHF